LICREVCLADHAQLHLSLPFDSRRQSLNSATAPVFANATKLLPKAIPAGWATSAELGKDSLVLRIRAGKPISKAEFFPLDPGQIDNAARQNLEPTARGAKITLKKSDLLMKPIASLRGVLVIANGDAYQVEAPVTKR
jgi:DsbC/DsbD-like thiol-disulfide interchange protein